MDMFTSDAAKQMAIEIDRDVLLGTFDQCAAENKGATAGVISGAYNLGTDVAPLVLTKDNVLTVFTALASVLDEQNVPDTDRWLVITPYVRNLLMSSPLSQAYLTGDSQSILRNGRIGMIDRFTLYVSNLLPSAEAGEDFDTDFGTLVRGLNVYGYKVIKPEALALALYATDGTVTT